MSHLLIVDAHLGVAGQAPLPRQRGGSLLPPSRSSSRPGCRQARSTSGGSTDGLRITVVANPPGNQPSRDHRSSCAPQSVELPMEHAGPLYKEHTSSILGASPDDRMSIAALKGEPELL